MKKITAEVKKRKTVNEKRLAAYTAAAGAALLAAAPADAAVQYSGVVSVGVATSLYSSGGSSKLIDINGDGTNDLNFWAHKTFANSWRGWGSLLYKTFNMSGGFSNLNGVSFVGGAGLPSNLGAGSIIDVSDVWTNNNGKLFFGNVVDAMFTSGGTGWVTDSVNGGNFTRGNPGYLGIKFDPGDGTKYGWIHVASVERNDQLTFFKTYSSVVRLI